MKPRFSRREFKQRTERTRARMDKAGIDVLFVTDPAKMNYLTGYDGWSFYVHQMVALSLDDPEPVWIGRPMDGNGARVTTYLKEKNILDYPDNFVQSDRNHPMDRVAEIAKSRGWHRKRVGVEMEAYYFTAGAMEALRKNLPRTRFKDARHLVNWVRIVKSRKELEYMAEAARIVERMMRIGIQNIQPGTRQCDVAAEIWRTGVAGTRKFGGDYPSLPPMLPTGSGIAAPHLTWTDERFKRGEGTALELAGVRHRYHCPMARTVFLGQPPKKMRSAAKVVLEGLQAALDAMTPGTTAEEVEAAWRRVVSRHGITKESRIGYSTGLNYPPDWGEHTISLRPGDRTLLQENMTLHCVPAIAMEGWAIEISECVRVTRKGGKPLCDFPRKLFIKR
ncbi:MAG TPA: M24 family metallopeptidase [Gammaproteobacteria bacterium]|nr:M24 family metallopeptidase [Gammaproteobacteria bacterium]